MASGNTITETAVVREPPTDTDTAVFRETPEIESAIMEAPPSPSIYLSGEYWDQLFATALDAPNYDSYFGDLETPDLTGYLDQGLYYTDENGDKVYVGSAPSGDLVPEVPQELIDLQAQQWDRAMNDLGNSLTYAGLTGSGAGAQATIDLGSELATTQAMDAYTIGMDAAMKNREQAWMEYEAVLGRALDERDFVANESWNTYTADYARASDAWKAAMETWQTNIGLAESSRDFASEQAWKAHESLVAQQTQTEQWAQNRSMFDDYLIANTENPGSTADPYQNPYATMEEEQQANANGEYTTSGDPVGSVYDENGDYVGSASRYN